MRVLLATDGSEDAHRAIRWLQMLPLPAGSSILIVTVAVVPGPHATFETVAELRAAAVAEAKRTAERARRVLIRRWPAAEVHVSEGDPREEIVRIAEEWGADLVVVGARGLSGVKRFLLGSVSLAVARHAPCPVLVAKGEPRKPRVAVVGVDGSEDSLRALRFLAALEPKRLVTRLLGVVEDLRYPSSAPSIVRSQLNAAIGEMKRERRAELEKALERAQRDIEGRVGRVRVAIVDGSADDVIVRAANGPGVGLAVVGARGLGAVKRLLLGSVSETVLRYARCPVLIVRRSPKG